MENLTPTNAPTFESVWALMQENARQQKENERIFNKQLAKNERLFREQVAENNRFLKDQAAENEKQLKELKMQIQENAKHIGGISASNGEFCEEYFVNTFKINPTFLGEKFDRVLDNLKPDPMVVNDQYDLVLRNGKTIVLIEMKYKAKVSDVRSMFLKLKSYRANYPMFNNYKIYLCLASFSFRDYVKSCAAKEGVVLIQQRGEKIEIVSEKVRYWE